VCVCVWGGGGGRGPTPSCETLHIMHDIMTYVQANCKNVKLMNVIRHQT